MDNSNGDLQRLNFMGKAKLVFVFLLASLFAAACSDTSSVSPTPPSKNPPQTKASAFQPVEITISGIGTDSMKAQARPAGGRAALPTSSSAPGDGSGNHGSSAGSIQIRPLSNGSFTYGGMRYVYATFKIRNADGNGTVYTNARHNLTFIATNTDNTYGNTAISSLRLFDNTKLSGTDAENMAEQITPTGQVSLNTASQIISTGPDVLQVYSESEVNDIDVTSGETLFPYGFITRSPDVTPGSRDLPASPASGEYDGVVTFAFKMPLQKDAAADPFKITGLFTPVDQTTTRITQSPQEQSTGGRSALMKRQNDLNPSAVTILPGSRYQLSSSATQLRCAPVRVAGVKGSATTTLQAASVNKISTISPQSGSPDMEVTIRGCDLDGASVTVGGQNATVVSSSSQSLVFNVPAGLNPGQDYKVNVTNNGNTSTDNFKASAVEINEFLADPASGMVAGDANGDGVRDAGDDEFIEVVNGSSQDVDISGWQLSDDGGDHIRYTFPSGTTLQAGKAAVIFGGGSPTGSFGGAFVGKTSSLSLSNSSGTVALLNKSGKVVSMHAYGSEGGDDQSLTRSPDITGSFVKYSNASGHTSKAFSPGTKVDGSSF